MYTTTIGRIFLKEYNERNQLNCSAKDFFVDSFLPLFFDHQKYMMTGGNSPLENPKISWEKMIKGVSSFETPEKRKERMDKMVHKIENEKADMSIAMGYNTLKIEEPTFSQTTSIEFADNKEDIYLSWIGAALGIGISGGITILFNNPQILYDTYEGWQHYRYFLENYPNLKGNQVNTWNGIWIEHRYGDDYDEDDPIADINAIGSKMGEEIFSLETVRWTDILLNIAYYIDINDLIGYMYNLGQTNTTLGFIPFELASIKRPDEFYKKIFGEDVYKQDITKVKKLYGTEFGIRYACQMGAIGVKALQPKGVRSYINDPKKSIKYQGDNIITFNTYLIWILAMLNNETLWDKSQEIAELLLAYESSQEKKISTGRKNKVKQLLESTSAKTFLQNLIPIIEDESEVEAYKNIAKVIHEMPRDNFSYFNTLIRLQFAIINK